MGRYTCDVCFISHDNYWIWNDIYDACSYECLMSWKNKMNPQQKDAHHDTVQNGGDTIEKKRQYFEKKYPNLPRYWVSSSSPSPSPSPSFSLSPPSSSPSSSPSPSPSLSPSPSPPSSSLSSSPIASTTQKELKEENDKLNAQLRKFENSTTSLKNNISDLQAQVKKLTDEKAVMEKKKYPYLTITKAWGFGKNPMCSPAASMALEVGEQVFLIQQQEAWLEISHPDKGQAWVHNSCFDILEVGSIWRHPDNSYARPVSP